MKPERVNVDYLEDILEAIVEVTLLTEASDGKESARKKTDEISPSHLELFR